MEILRLAALTYLESMSLDELTVIAPYAAEISIPAGRRVLLDGPFAQELALDACVEREPAPPREAALAHATAA